MRKLPGYEEIWRLRKTEEEMSIESLLSPNPVQKVTNDQ